MDDPVNEKKPKSPDLPEQKLGDTPIPPWEMPTSEEKAQAKPFRRALKEAVSEVDSPEKAEQVIEQLEKDTAGQAAEDVKKTQPSAATPEAAAQPVKEKAETAPEKILKAAARALVTLDKHQREIVSEAAQEVFNPEQQGAAPSAANQQQREYLRGAVLKRLKPIDALDASLFLKVNHLPHTHLLNTLFYGITLAFNGAATWYAVTAMAALQKRRRLSELLREVVLPLAITTALVEYPIKWYFKRRRPFITIIQAIVIGKKPGTWSFPSGHSAGAFAGAWLLNHIFPRSSKLRYLMAGLVAFSRIYLGDHYPGDVTSGSVLGLLFARLFHRLFSHRR